MNPAEIENTRLEFVKVTNNLPFAFTDRYDGVPFEIAPGKSDNLPAEVAAHFFGPNFDDLRAMAQHIAKRQGWNTPEYVKVNEDTGKNKAQELFEKLKIERVSYKLTPVADDPREPIPADPLPTNDAPVLTKKRGSKSDQQSA